MTAEREALVTEIEQRLAQARAASGKLAVLERAAKPNATTEQLKEAVAVLEQAGDRAGASAFKARWLARLAVEQNRRDLAGGMAKLTGGRG